MKKARKIPRLFRKKYTEKAFSRKILKRIHIPREREKMEALFEKNENNKYILKRDIPSETLKKLKSLAKTIKKNKGLVTRWKAVIVLVIVGSVLIFNLIFKDKLIEDLAESGLESLFNAEVDIEKLELSLVRGIVSYDSLTIADGEKPMFNLIETGRAVLKISMRELAFKRLHFDEISLRDVLWNTPRESDGALKEEGNREENPSGNDGSSLRDTLSFKKGDFDYQLLLNSQKDNLKSLKLLTDSNRKIDEARVRWTEVLSEKKDEVETLTAEVSKVKSINLSNVKSVNEARTLIEEVQSYYPEVLSAKDSVAQLNRDIKMERASLSAMKDSLSESIDADIVYLVDTLDLSPGDLSHIASDLAENYIRSRWENYYEYGLKAWNIVQKLQNSKQEEEAKTRGLKRASGRTILFPSPAKPTFLISHIGLTGGDERRGDLILDISSLSSEPDKIEEPATLNLLLTKGEQIIDLNAVLDLTAGSPELFKISVDVPESSVELKEGVPAMGVSRFTSAAKTNVRGTVLRGEKTLMTVVKTELSELEIIQSEDDSLISGVVKDLIDQTGTVELTGEMAITKEGIDSLSLQSDFDKLLRDSLGGYLEDLESSYREELKGGLLEFLSSEMGKNEILSSSLDALGGQSLEQLSSVNGAQSVLDNKIGELESRGDAIADELKSKAQSEARNTVEKAIDKIKLPGF